AAVVLTAVSTGGVWSGTGVVGNTFDPTIALAGDHTIQYDVVNGACSDSDTEVIHVDSEVIATITPIGPFCETEAAVGLTAVSPGGVWSGTGVVGNTFDPTIALAGDHTIQYDVVNGACSDSDTEVIHVDSEVIATITPIGPFCETEAAVGLTAVSPGGVWSGTVLPGNIFNPSIVGPGDYVVRYDVVNGVCSDFDTHVITVYSEIDAIILAAGPYCDNISIINLTANYSGGTWSGNGVLDPIAGLFSPSTAGAGDHSITYTLTNGACEDIDNVIVHVDSSPDATITEILPICETIGLVTLSSVTTGGIWSGTGVIGNNFDPVIAGQGDHVITHIVTNGTCSDTDNIIIHVDTLPDATITPAGPFCEDYEFAYLQAVSSGGIWSGTGVTNPITGQFSPLFSGIGNHDITYSVINGTCTDSDSFTIVVNDYLDATITPIGALCQSGDLITLHAANPGGTWSGQGIIDPINGILDPSQVQHGDNTMVYTLTNGACISTDIHIYQVDAQVDATILSNPGTICLDNPPFILLTVEPNGTWTGQGVSNLTTGAYNPNQAGVGTHEITYSLSNGTCYDSDTIYITVNPIPDVNILTEGPFCENDDPVTLIAATDGGAWSGIGVLDNVFDPQIAGPGDHTITYELTLNGCSATGTKILHVDSATDATITQTGPFCVNSGPNILIAATIGGIWSGNGMNNGYFYPENAGFGNHLISYTVTNGACSDTDEITIIVDNYTDVTITAVDAMCSNDPPVNITASVLGGIWSGTGIINPATGLFDPASSGPGTFTITYSFTNGTCIINTTTTLIVNPTPIVLISNFPESFCYNDNYVVVVTSPPGGILSGPGVSMGAFHPQVAGPGTHTIQYVATNVYGCTDMTSATVEVFPGTSTNISIPDDEFCLDDEAVSLDGTPSGGIFEGPGIEGNKFIPGIAGSGIHELFYIYTDDYGCVNTASVLVEVSTPLTINLTGENLICFGINTGYVNAEVTGGVPDYTYLWDDPSNSTTPLVENLSSGTYSITVTDSWGCDDTTSITITEPTQLSLNISSVSYPDCYDQTNGHAFVLASGGTPPYSYIWDDDNNTTSALLNNVGEGIYHLTVTDANGCDGVILVVISQPDELIAEIISQTNVGCNGVNNGSATVNVTGGTPPYQYIWDNPAHTPLATANHLAAGTYNVSITDANGCTASTSVIITESSNMTAEIITTDVICAVRLGTATINVDGGHSPYSYHWSSGSITNNAYNLSYGAHYVTVIDDQNCQYITSVNIGISGSINANIIQDQGILCGGSNDASLHAVTTNGISPLDYLWSNGIRTQYNSYIGAGHYEVTIIDDWGCTGSYSHDISPLPLMTITPTVTGAGCFGGETGTITISVSGGTQPYNIIWSTNETTFTISDLAAGYYQVTVTDANNCVTLGNYYISNPENPLDIDFLVRNIKCANGNDGAISITASGGTPGYLYSWEYEGNTFSGSSANNLYPGIYNVTVSDAQGCEMDTTIVITEPEAFEYSFVSINPSCIGNSDGYVEIIVIGGTPPYNLSWSNQTSPAPYITGLRQGTYMFTIIDDAGCTHNTETIELVDDNVECIAIPTAFTPNFDGINDTWLIENIELFPWAIIQVYNRWGQLVFEGSGAGEPWDGKWNGKIVPTGSYVYTVDLLNGTKYCGIVTVIQ
ncbi:MAG TPA: gliding motility-associated C-terminal domain-containing protein, partial [Bacteroidales bacterium]|nr:gliding motility-associated C-terminal domain-containing protein [Bacteroidales bacterium]